MEKGPAGGGDLAVVVVVLSESRIVAVGRRLETGAETISRFEQSISIKTAARCGSSYALVCTRASLSVPLLFGVQVTKA